MAEVKSITIDIITRENINTYWRDQLYMKYYITSHISNFRGHVCEKHIVTIVDINVKSMDAVSPRDLQINKAAAHFVTLSKFLQLSVLNIAPTNIAYIRQKIQKHTGSRQLWFDKSRRL